MDLHILIPAAWNPTPSPLYLAGPHRDCRVSLDTTSSSMHFLTPLALIRGLCYELAWRFIFPHSPLLNGYLLAYILTSVGSTRAEPSRSQPCLQLLLQRLTLVVWLLGDEISKPTLRGWLLVRDEGPGISALVFIHSWGVHIRLQTSVFSAVYWEKW